jgi:hypothetical protein
MELKFLKEGTNIEEADGIEVEFVNINSSLQTLLIGLGVVKTNVGRVALTVYILKNVVTKLTIDGEEIDPKFMADRADLSDPGMVKVFFKIANLVMNQAMLGEGTKKKSEQPESPSEKEGSAQPVLDRGEEDLPKPV